MRVSGGRSRVAQSGAAVLAPSLADDGAGPWSAAKDDDSMALDADARRPTSSSTATQRPYVLVIDTNFFLAHRGWLAHLLEAAAETADMAVLVPWVVIEELDALKVCVHAARHPRDAAGREPHPRAHHRARAPGPSSATAVAPMRTLSALPRWPVPRPGTCTSG